MGRHTAVLAFDQHLLARAVQAAPKNLHGGLGKALAEAVVAYWLLILALARWFWGRSRAVGWRNPESVQTSTSSGWSLLAWAPMPTPSRPNSRSSSIGD